MMWRNSFRSPGNSALSRGRGACEMTDRRRLRFRFSMRLALFLLAFGLSPSAAATDVAVYGATPAGICAAIGAAREGASVVLLEPTRHVGGVNTGGLCFSDSNQ